MHFKKELDSRVDTCCKLYEEIEEYKTKIDDMKKKAALGDKAGLEIQKMREELEYEKSQRSKAESSLDNFKKQVKENKDKIKNLNDQIGGLEDSLAAADYRNEGLESDLKALEKELNDLKGNQLQGKMAMGDKDETIKRLGTEKDRLNSVI